MCHGVGTRSTTTRGVTFSFPNRRDRLFVKKCLQGGSYKTHRLVMSSASPTEPSTTLQGVDQQRWQDTLQAVQALGMSQEETERCVSRAFGWTSQAYWRQEKVEEVPDPDQISDVVAFLAELGIQGDDLLKVIKAFPEVLGCSVDGRLKVSVNKLEKEYRMKGDILTRALIRRPEVLGYTYDCEGNCIGECNRCWVRF